MICSEPLPESVKQFFEIATNYLVIQNDRAPVTCKQQVEILGQFIKFCAGHGVQQIDSVSRDVVESFIHLPVSTLGGYRAPQESTQRNRRTALRLAYRAMRQLGYEIFDPLADVQTVNRQSCAGPVCNDSQIEVLRQYSLNQLHASLTACVLALAEAGAKNSEITTILGSTLNWLNGTVHLPGNSRTDSRTNQLTPWGVDTLRKHFGDHEPHELIVTNAFGQPASSSSISQSFKQLTMFSSLGRHKFSLNSVRAWRAKQIFNQTQHIECVAKFLGVRSLDTAAQMIGWHWRQAP